MAGKRRREKGSGSVYRQPGSPYYYMAYWVGGKRKVRSTKQTDEADAKLVLEEKIFELKMEWPGVPASEAEWPFKQVADRWLKTKLGSGIQPSTKNELRIIVECHLIPAMGSWDIHLIQTSDLEEYMWAKTSGLDYNGNYLPVEGGATGKPLSAAFVRKHMQTLKQIFAFAQHNNLLSNQRPNPVANVNTKQLRNRTTNRSVRTDRILERTQILALVAAAPDDWEKLLYRLMAQMGLRIGEAVALKAGDYDPGRKLMRVRRTQRRNPNFTGDETKRGQRTHLIASEDEAKTNAGVRDLKVSEEIHELIVRQICSPERKQRLTRNSDSTADWLVPSKIGTMLSPNSLAKNRWQKAITRAGIPEGFTFHSLRHTFASHQLAKGVPVTQVSHWLGHANPQVTMTVYAHIINAQAEEVASLTL
jgi:integrase